MDAHGLVLRGKGLLTSSTAHACRGSAGRSRVGAQVRMCVSCACACAARRLRRTVANSVDRHSTCERHVPESKTRPMKWTVISSPLVCTGIPNASRPRGSSSCSRPLSACGLGFFLRRCPFASRRAASSAASSSAAYIIVGRIETDARVNGVNGSVKVFGRGTGGNKRGWLDVRNGRCLFAQGCLHASPAVCLRATRTSTPMVATDGSRIACVRA
jgi:hypothetical protein